MHQGQFPCQLRRIFRYRDSLLADPPSTFSGLRRQKPVQKQIEMGGAVAFYVDVHGFFEDDPQNGERHQRRDDEFGEGDVVAFSVRPLLHLP